jgi:hypothetical protein
MQRTPGVTMKKGKHKRVKRSLRAEQLERRPLGEAPV